MPKVKISEGRTQFWLINVLPFLIAGLLVAGYIVIGDGEKTPVAPVSAPAVHQQKTPQLPTIEPKDWVMSAQAAFDYLEQTVGPMIEKRMRDPEEIPAIRDRIIRLMELNTKGAIEYKAMPAYYPKSPTTLTKVDYNLKTDKPVLVVFVPAIQNLQQEISQAQFEDAIAVIYAHEMMHLELESVDDLRARAGKTDLETRNLEAKNEAAVWCKMIMEMIRPMAALGRAPNPEWTAASNSLKQMGDTCTDPGLIEKFRDLY